MEYMDELTEEINNLMQNNCDAIVDVMHEVVGNATATERERCMDEVDFIIRKYIGWTRPDEEEREQDAEIFLHIHALLQKLEKYAKQSAIMQGENPQVKIARTELYFEGETHELKKVENDEPTA
jgi:hypothetical protein